MTRRLLGGTLLLGLSSPPRRRELQPKVLRQRFLKDILDSCTTCHVFASYRSTLIVDSSCIPFLISSSRLFLEAVINRWLTSDSLLGTCFRGRCKHGRYESSPSISQVNIIKLFLQSVAFIYYFLLNSFSHLYSFSTASYWTLNFIHFYFIFPFYFYFYLFLLQH